MTERFSRYERLNWTYFSNFYARKEIKVVLANITFKMPFSPSSDLHQK
jgi:hypothetical protein